MLLRRSPTGIQGGRCDKAIPDHVGSTNLMSKPIRYANAQTHKEKNVLLISFNIIAYK